MGRRPSARKPSFMKILVGDFSKKLLIPPKFVRLYRGTLPRKCKLRPSHTQHSWPVRTKQMDNFLYFSKGWRKFARYHSLESHDLLVFRYAQDSEFYVDMFDQSCCSKEPLTSKNMDSRMNTSPTILPSKEKTVNPKTPASSAAEELMASSEFPTFKKVMRPIYVKSGGYLHLPLEFTKMHLKDSTREVKIEVPDKTWTIGIARDRSTSRLTKGWCHIVREKGLKVKDVCVFQLTNTKDFTLKLSIFSSTSGKKQKQCQAKSKASCIERNLTSKDISAKAIEEAEKFESRSKYPSVVIVMQPAYVENGYLHVPSAFRKKICKKEGDNDVKLQWSGEEWRAVMRNVRGQGRITAGWGTFVKDKSIEVDDVCVLEFINKEDDVIVIKISNFKCKR